MIYLRYEKDAFVTTKTHLFAKRIILIFARFIVPQFKENAPKDVHVFDASGGEILRISIGNGYK